MTDRCTFVCGVAVKSELSERIREYPGDRSEADWLETFELLRSRLSDALSTVVHLGCYWIDDFPGHASASGCARVRGGNPIVGVPSDSWEGVLCWSGNRGSSGYADAMIFPFLNEYAVTQRGRIADLSIEVTEYLNFRFQDETFVNAGWPREDGPGEWAAVTVPGSVYWQRVEVIPPAHTVTAGAPIFVDLRLPRPISPGRKRNPHNLPRISLIHANRDRDGGNLAPWTAQPPLAGSPHVQLLADSSFLAGDVVRVRLDTFNIRGGWMPGKYHLSLRVQNFHRPGDWAWSCDISPPFDLAIQ